jgi:hypothetical protein
MIFLLLSSVLGLADDSIGMTVVSRGDVEVISLGETRPLGRGDFLSEGDQIIAGTRSFAVLQFADGAKVSLRPDSSLIIEHYQFAGIGEDGVTLNLLAGGLRVNQGAISSQQPDAYRIRTPSGMLIMNKPEGTLSLCGNEICEQQGFIESSN